LAYLNKTMLIGNLGKDPEIRVTTGGTKKASFSIATTERYKDKASGETKDKTEWHNIVAWGNTADLIERLGIRKGISLYIEGKLTSRSWDDPSGQKKYITEIVMESFQILTPRSAQSGQAQGQDAGYSGAGADAGSDDLPF